MLIKPFCQLWLTCEDKAEADKIAKVLLDKHLVACAKQIPITSDFLWEGKIEHGKEILLVMDSREDLFSDVEKEVTKHHSYDTFVLQAIPVSNVSKKAQQWLSESLKN